MADLGKYADATIPSWINGILHSMRWEVLTYTIDVGYWLRYILNWILARINERHRKLFENDQELAYRIQTKYNQLQNAIASVIFLHNDLFKRVDAIEYTLVTWLDVNSSPLKSRVMYWLGPTQDLVLALAHQVQHITGIIDSPDPPWWRPDQILAAITEGIGNIIYPGAKTEQDAKNLFQWLYLFFADPPKFLYSMADEMIRRFL